MTDETAPIGGTRAGSTSHRRGLVGRIANHVGGLSIPGLIEAENERLFLWAPVAFACGIAIYFALPREPSLAAVAVFCAGLGAAAVRAGRGRLPGILAIALFLAALGLLDAAWRTQRVAGPVVEDSGWASPVTGRVVSVEDREGGAARIVIAPDAISDWRPDMLPRRLSLWKRGNWPVPPPGATVTFDAVLMPPPDAAVPGGFDYARQAWFAGIGGVGFVTSAPEFAAPRTGTVVSDLAARVEILRQAVTEAIKAALPGHAGAIAAALITGKRGAIPESDVEALRASGLAHILAISGLHMMLVVGTLFWAARATFALSPSLALTRPIKKWAAAIALAGGSGYLVLSGASIATQRAFVMAAIMLVAVLLDRPAISLRNVAIAALVVLALTPEALVTASFQMSFAATVALVAGYEALRTGRAGHERTVMPGPVRFLWRAVFGLVLTALIAGLATGPYAAFHFNRVAVYGLVGNIAAMPLVSALVMPAGLAAVCLMPFGLEWLPLAIMGAGIEGVLRVAETVAGWAGSVRMVPQMPMSALLTITIGGLWLALWRTPLRYAGLAVIAIGTGLAVLAPRPDLYVARDGAMAAFRSGDEMVFLPRPGSDYETEMWLRSAGLDTAAIAAGPSPACDGAACVADNGRLRVSYVFGAMAFAEDCAWADVVVTRLNPPAWCGREALVIGPAEQAALGAVTLRQTGSGLLMRTAVEVAGERPWARRGAPAD